MRDLEVIDSELGLLLAIRNMARDAEGRTPKYGADRRAAGRAGGSSKRLSRQYARGRVKI